MKMLTLFALLFCCVVGAEEPAEIKQLKAKFEAAESLYWGKLLDVRKAALEQLKKEKESVQKQGKLEALLTYEGRIGELELAVTVNPATNEAPRNELEEHPVASSYAEKQLANAALILSKNRAAALKAIDFRPAEALVVKLTKDGKAVDALDIQTVIDELKANATAAITTGDPPLHFGKWYVDKADQRKNSWKFNADGSCAMILRSKQFTGTYVIDKKQITFSVPGVNDPRPITIETKEKLTSWATTKTYISDEEYEAWLKK
jgi:hypothetical protein